LLNCWRYRWRREAFLLYGKCGLGYPGCACGPAKVNEGVKDRCEWDIHL
jgi:hypothetical protein